MRAIWSGSLSFGLVNIPVRLYSASRERALSFRLLDKKHHSPISYKKVRRDDNQEVEQKDIVKGYEYEKGEYVILEPEDFKKASPKKTQALEIVQFVDAGDVEAVYFDKPYYLEPDERAAKAYALLRDALKQAGKAAIADYVIKDKEHIGLIEPQGNLLSLIQLRYKDELRAPEIALPKGKEYSEKEMKLALSLIENLAGDFDPEKYKDTYTDELMKVIEAKAKGKRITIGKEEAPQATSTADILKALQKSLSEAPEPIRNGGTKRVQKKKKLRKNA